MPAARVTALLALTAAAVLWPAAAPAAERARASASAGLTLTPDSGARPARSYGIWRPGRFDSCPAALHDRYATRGPGGKLYPGWHPPVVRNPATGRRCSFGHEHGRDPRRSDLYRWVARRLGGGLPFGAASEALDAYARANPGTPTRHEDHVGHKVEWANDVPLLRATRRGRRAIGVRCDFLAKIHQGTHSGDAFANNAHELIYAVACSDGTRLLTTTLARFGSPNGFTRSCDLRTAVPTGGAPAFPAGPGSRGIPDRSCVERHLLVPPDRFSMFARGLYENWASSNRLTTPGGRQIAYWDPHFAVFNPARYFDPGRPGALARTVGACWERPASGERASGSACDVATGYGTQAIPLAFDDPRSPFDGSHRETYFNQTTIRNPRGPRRWYTDPYGRQASRRPFPGALCQIVARTDNSSRPTLESQAFGSERPYGARGVHAPN
jgi:hypothetical protein